MAADDQKRGVERLKGWRRRVARWVLRYWPGLLVAGLTVIALITLILFLTSWDFWKKEEGVRLSESVRNFGLLDAALIALGFGIWRAHTGNIQAKAADSQARTAAQGLFAGRFGEATKQLGDEKLFVRLGGIYALHQLSRGAKDADIESILTVLCTFVRSLGKEADAQEGATADGGENAPSEEDEKTRKEETPPKLRPDVQEAMTAMFDPESGIRAQHSQRRQKAVRLDLNGADLSRADLSGADLLKANLSGANLSKATLSGAKLSNATFYKAILIEADLFEANLTNANFLQADLKGAVLIDAKLKRARFGGADLADADFLRCDVAGVDFRKAINLTQAQVDQMFYFKGFQEPRLPEGLKPPEPRPIEEGIG